MSVADHLMLEPLIIDRLSAELGNTVRQVASAADLAGVTEGSQISPAIHVLYAGDQIPTGEGARGQFGVPQQVEQRWNVVVAVRNARTQRSGAAARNEAGPLLAAVCRALAGWQPDAAFTAFRRRNAPPPAYTGTFGYFPTQWTTEFYQ